MIFDPWPEADIHLEWGAVAAAQAAQRGDAVVIVDVLSFSTTLTVAVERGMDVLVLSMAEIADAGGLERAARDRACVPISRHRAVDPGGLSLSPSAMLAATHADRILVTSFNGAAVAAAADESPLVLVGCLRNARACAAVVSAALRSVGGPVRVTVVAAGELWESTVPQAPGARPALEDAVGAGAICRHLAAQGWSLSAEATAAAALQVAVADLHSCVSARELIAADQGADLAPAFGEDAGDMVPVRADPSHGVRLFTGVRAPTPSEYRR